MAVNLSFIGGAGWQFLDNNGVPLSGGKVYTYAAGTTTPQTTYTSRTGLTPNTNPIILDAAGRTPEQIWSTEGLLYKYVVTDTNNVLIRTWDNIGGSVVASNLAQDLAAPTGSSLVGFTLGETGAVAQTVQDKLREQVSVFDFMTSAQIAAVKANTSTEDLSSCFQNAINTNKRVYVPKGTYRVNVTINSKTIIEGDGSTATILQPYNNAVAIMTYTFTAQQTPQLSYWNYHSEIKNIQFLGKDLKTGVGFTFGKTNPSDYQANDEYANNVKFYACMFKNLNKGVQFPFGNIGSEFYSCGFQNNTYGVYTLNNKFGAVMHAGNKYFYAGEMNNNDCAIYCHNTADGFGAIIFDNVIFEFNRIAAYTYQNTVTYVPITFNSVWFENNGGGTPITIDNWTGSTKSTQTIAARTLIFDGVNGNFVANASGVLGDIHIKATNTTFTLNNCRVESSAGFNGGLATVDNPDNSAILMYSCYSDGGVIRGASQVSMNAPTYFKTISNNPTSAGLTAFQTISRSSKVTNYGPSRIMSAALTTAATTTGSFTLTGSVVSDGVLYDQCNEFTRVAFASNEFTRLSSPNSEIITTAGYYVFTLDLKITLGSVTVWVWNRSTAQFASLNVPELNRWYTFAGIGYSPGSQSLFLDFQGANIDATWRVSAYQIHRFDTYQQAQSFLTSGVFAQP